MQIQFDLHTHTIASTHAYSTIIENCEAARDAGLKGIAITDHSVKMPDAPHDWHFGNMDILPRVLKNVTVLRGIEANVINDDGELDIYDYLYYKLEWIVASFHTPTYKPTNEETHLKTFINICKNEHIDVFGHPTTIDHKFDYMKGIKYAKEYDKLIEINEASYLAGRSPKENIIEILNACKKYDCEIVLDTDSHFCYNIGIVDGVSKIIEEIDFPKRLIANLEYDKIIEKVKKKRPWVKF